MTGIELIVKEREEQLNKHNRSIENDHYMNDEYQLRNAAIAMLGWRQKELPYGWNKELWDKMFKKTEIERLAIAGALIAAEIDRINFRP